MSGPSSNERRAFSVAVFCRHEGCVLLIRHKRLGTWLPVGGEIEAGESPYEAAERELFEETGLRGVFPKTNDLDGSPLGLIGYEEHAAGSKGLHMNFAFVADVPARDLAACDEYTDVKWIADASDVHPCPDNVRQLVRSALAAPSPPSKELDKRTHAMTPVRITRVGAIEMALPAYQTTGAAGLDLAAAIGAPLTIEPGERALVPTGFAFEIPIGFEGQVRPRSGLALRSGITVLNTPGTIDSDYRGEVKVVLVNLGKESFTVSPGDRIAQLVITPTVRASLQLVDDLGATSRGSGGYGSTGTT